MTASKQDIGFDSANQLLVGEDAFVDISLSDDTDLSGSPQIAWRVADVAPTGENSPETKVEKTLASGGIIIVSATSPKSIRIILSAADTTAIGSGDLYHEAQIIDQSGRTSKPTVGTIRVQPSVFS